MNQPVVRFIIALIIGLIAGMLVVMAMEMLSHQLFSLPDGIDPMSPEGSKYIMENAPLSALILVPLGWMLAAFAAVWVATRIKKDAGMRFMIIFALLLLAASVFNMISIPSPVWWWAMALLGIPAMAYLGRKTAS